MWDKGDKWLTLIFCILIFSILSKLFFCFLLFLFQPVLPFLFSPSLSSPPFTLFFLHLSSIYRIFFFPSSCSILFFLPYSSHLYHPRPLLLPFFICLLLIISILSLLAIFLSCSFYFTFYLFNLPPISLTLVFFLSYSLLNHFLFIPLIIFFFSLY